jgi:hypothetical protein
VTLSGGMWAGVPASLTECATLASLLSLKSRQVDSCSSSQLSLLNVFIPD